MTLKKIKKEQLQARKSKDKFKASILTTLISEIEIVGKNKRNGETSEEEAIKVIEKFKKNAESTKDLMIENDALDEEIENKYWEIELYKEYLPKQLSEDELRNIIKDIIDHDSDINIGKVMGFLKKQYNGQYDGKLASKLVKELL